MGWFDEQIKLRKQNDNSILSDSYERMAAAVTGRKVNADSLELSRDAILDILKFYGCKPKEEVPAEITDFNEQVEFLCRPFGIMRRRVTLTEDWYKDATGALLGIRRDDGSLIALLPTTGGYRFLNNGKYERVNKGNADLIGEQALCFYKPFPLRKLSSRDLIEYSIRTRSVNDYLILGGFLLISTLLGLLLPKISYFLYSDVVESNSYSLLASTVVFLLAVSVSTILFNLYKTMYNSIVGTKMTISVQAASMMRVLSLPANFFRKYSSGELSSRVSSLTSLCDALMSVIFSSGFTSLFSLVYIGSIVHYAPGLVWPAIILILVTVAFSVLTTFVQMKITKEEMKLSAKVSGISYSMITGIQKIRLGGAEKRAFSRWANLFSKSANLAYNPPLFLKINGVITTAISLVGTIVLYFFAIKTNVSLAEYNAFNTAYGMVFGAFTSLATIATTLAQVKPIMEMAQPLLETVPEVDEQRKVVTHLSGAIELNNVSFRYNESMPLVVDNLSLKIRSGQYVAIVGKTGCGKSTLIRLLLGFEKPQKGAIYYDGQDINSLDLRSLRRGIGVVLQDGKLFSGEIFNNITITAPWLTLEDAWRAADMAGIGDDIRRMPMGMNTYISEGAGGISGGQRQRLLIARAIAPKPKILIFDEATSALDNITQKRVSESLDSLKCTRIVIAHRLSTIRHCDRILYLEDGRIKEDGTYEELIAKDGLFADLVKRQRLDKETE